LLTRLWNRRHQPWVMLWPLALAQMTSWGTMFYSFSLFAGPMQRELGWSQPAMNTALTLGLLMTAVMAYPVGTLFDRTGGRWLMTLGSLGGGLLLLVWSDIKTLPQFYVMWLTLGVCMACCLMEPLMAVINRVFGKDARRGMIAVTMVTGLSGTVFVPLSGHLINVLDWRPSMALLGALNLLYCAPVHWWFVPPHDGGTRTQHPLFKLRGRVHMRRRLRNPVFWGLALWYTSYSLTASSLIFQFVPLLRAEQVADSVIFSAFALIGPMQVAARMFIVTVARHASIARLGAFTSALSPLAVLILIYAPHERWWLYLFATCFATGHGITTILRGIAPVEWLGREHFARTMGAIALPMSVAMATAPSLTAQVWSASGSSRAMLWMVFAGALLGTVGYWLAVTSRRRARRLALARVPEVRAP
jgi:MFS family permease